MRHTTRLPIQFRDLDALGHLNSTAYIQYLETARVDLLASLAPSSTWYRPPIIVVALRAEYRTPIADSRAVMVDAWVSRIGNSSWDLDYEIRPTDGPVAAIGRSTQVCYDHADAQVRPITATLRAHLEQHRHPPLLFR